MWDTRSNQLPVLKTPLSAGGHTYPIYSMKFVGSHNAHNLVTASTDGTVCTWMGDMLTIPQVSRSRHLYGKRLPRFRIGNPRALAPGALQ
jgi:dynein intermediate chain